MKLKKRYRKNDKVLVSSYAGPDVWVILKERYIADESEFKLGVDGWHAQIYKQKDIENVQRIKNEKLANQLFLQKEQKRKEWIKKQSERRAIRQILEEKLSNEAREREMEDKRRREDIRMKKEFIAREKRQDAAAKKDIQLKQLLHFEKEETQFPPIIN